MSDFALDVFFFLAFEGCEQGQLYEIAIMYVYRMLAPIELARN